MGKYSAFKGVLTKFSTEPEYQDKVNEEKKRVRDGLAEVDQPINFKTLATVLIAARKEKKALEDLIKASNLTIEAVTQELVEIMEALSFNMLKLDGGVSISIKDDVYVTVKDKEQWHQWVRDNELHDLFTVNYQTMSSLVKNKLVDGEDIPPGVDTYFKQGIIVRGIKDLGE